jgi:hypothetical protein
MTLGSILTECKIGSNAKPFTLTSPTLENAHDKKAKTLLSVGSWCHHRRPKHSFSVLRLCCCWAWCFGFYARWSCILRILRRRSRPKLFNNATTFDTWSWSFLTYSANAQGFETKSIVENQIAAVLTILRGTASLSATAKRMGTSRQPVESWVETFVGGGRLALTKRLNGSD